MPKVTETTLEINLNHLEHNFRYLKSRTASQVKFLAVVKAFAYGSDANKIARSLQDLGVDYFAVAYTQEGVALRDAGITKPILVLHPQPDNFTTIIKRCLEPNLYSKRLLEAFLEVAPEQAEYPIHLKFNTGLNRLGFNASDVKYIINALSKNASAKICSVFSHLAASEDFNEQAFTTQQIKQYDKITKTLEAGIKYPFIKHICNTSGILNYPQAHYNMVRSGIGLYGFGNSEKENKNLKPIARLKSVISQIHTLQPGDSVGYNKGFIADKKMRSATIPIGHADGLGRQYGKGCGFVFIHGNKAPILGNVCMDMIMVDVTHIACKEGDEVVVFDNTHTAETLAQATKTITYELLTSVSRRIKRVFTPNN